jgi:predicted NAD-dependent protein-ADP-ribosyltransferase YbiA (DUF1768 family)
MTTKQHEINKTYLVKVITMSSVLKFYSKSKEGKELSNFWNCDIEIFGRKYANGEAAFHGSKYLKVSEMYTDDNERRVILEEYGHHFETTGLFGDLSAAEIKSRGGKGKKGFKLTPNELQHWDNCSVDIQFEICQYKFDHYEEVRDVLKKSGQRPLVHIVLRVSREKVAQRKWEGGVDKETGEVYGENLLGEMWTELRLMM